MASKNSKTVRYLPNGYETDPSDNNVRDRLVGQLREVLRPASTSTKARNRQVEIVASDDLSQIDKDHPLKEIRDNNNMINEFFRPIHEDVVCLRKMGSEVTKADVIGDVRDSNNAINRFLRPDSESSDHCRRCSRLVAAIEERNLDDLEVVIGSDRDSMFVNVPCGGLKVTALQLAASEGEDGVKMVQLLLDKGADPNLSDKLGRTALHYAAASGSVQLLETLLLAGASPHSRFQVTPVVPTAPDKTDSGVVDGDEVDFQLRVFGKKKPPLERTRSYATVGAKLAVPECWGRTPLHQAVKGGFPACVKTLLDSGAQVNATDDRGLSPLLLAGAGVSADDDEAIIASYEEIVRLLVEGGAEVDMMNEDTGTTALHHAVALRSVTAARCLLDAGARITSNQCGETVLHEAARQGCSRVVNTLLEIGGEEYVNSQDRAGQTPLHLAAYNGGRDILYVLIQHGGDLSIMTSTGVSVMDAIFSHIPRPINFFSDVLDRCVVPNQSSVNDRSFKFQLNFRLLSPQGPKEQMAVVCSLMSGATYYQQMTLLQHPVLESYLRLKWMKLRIFFLLLLFVNVCFVISLSAYVILLLRRNVCLELVISRRTLIASASVVFLHGTLQMAMLPRHYFKEYETWMSLVCASMALVVSLAGEYYDFKVESCENQEANTTNLNTMRAEHYWVLHVMSIAVLLAWADLMLLIGRFPTWGLYALMFYRVLRNVFKVLLTFVCLMVGFAFSFSIQFNQLAAFSDPWRSFVRTAVMMMGEFEYSDMFEGAVVETEAEATEKAMRRLPVTSRIIFLVFLFLTSIVLMNLMVGLAVSDIQALVKESHIRRRLKQADFVTHLERFTSNKKLHLALPGKMTNFLKRRQSIETELLIQPSVHSSWTKKMNLVLLESIVEVAIKNQPKCAKTTGSNARSNDRKKSAVYRSESISSDERHVTMAVLQSLQREMLEIRDLLEIDRNTSQVIRRQADVMPYDLKQTGRPIGRAFSEVVIQGIQGQQMRKLKKIISSKASDRVNHVV